MVVPFDPPDPRETPTAQATTVTRVDSDPAEGELRFDRIQIKRGFQAIYEQIRNQIASGRLKPGDRLPTERQMAQMFGVSRQAVREALRGLEISGLIVLRVGVTGGAFVKAGDTDTVTRSIQDLVHLGRLTSESMLEARILVTSDAIRLASERGTDEDFDRLSEDTDLIERLTDAGDLRERTRRRVSFYRLLGQATHNEVFALLVDALTEIVAARLEAVGPDTREDLPAVRREVVRHLRARDAAAAIDVIVPHFQMMEEHLQSQEAKHSGT